MKGKTGFFKTLRGGLFFKYFLSYFLVFSVPLLLTLFMYSSSARIISAQSSGQATSLLGLLLCYLLTKKNSKPLKLIIRSLTTVYDHGRFDPEDDFQFIENAVSALVASNLAYHEKEKDIGSKTDREVLWRLFLGEGIDTAAFQRDLENSSIRLAGTQFVTGYLHVHGLDNSKQSAFFTKSSLWALLSQLFPEEGKSVHPLVIDKSNLVFLAVFGQEEAASQFCGELSLRLEGLGKQIEKDTGWHLDFFLSEAMRLAENVQVGYQQCKDLALRVVKDSGKFVYTTQDLPAFQQIYRYTMDQELRLAQLLQYGTQEELQAFLDELFEQNLRKLQLSDGMQKSFFTAVQNSALRSLSRFQLEKGAIHHETLNSPPRAAGLSLSASRGHPALVGHPGAAGLGGEKAGGAGLYQGALRRRRFDDLPPVRGAGLQRVLVKPVYSRAAGALLLRFAGKDPDGGGLRLAPAGRLNRKGHRGADRLRQRRLLPPGL